MINRTHPPKNSILTIRPYRLGSIWVFDYEPFDLVAEAFVGDINDMIDAMLQRADLPASEPFTAMFSSSPFPGHHMHLTWEREESGGNWYVDATPIDREVRATHEIPVIEGWLCPVLKMFWEVPPMNIYVRAES